MTSDLLHLSSSFSFLKTNQKKKPATILNAYTNLMCLLGKQNETKREEAALQRLATLTCKTKKHSLFDVLG